MVDSLPYRFNLEQLRKQVRDLCRAFDDRHEYATARVFAVFPEFKLGQKLKLADAYFIVAREHGFRNWPQMKLALGGAGPTKTSFVARMIGAESLEFKGNGMVEDSMSLALVALAKYLGRTISYEDANCLLGSAFAPAIDEEEDCLSHWCVNGAFAEPALGLACDTLGLSLEPMAPVTGSEATRQQALDAIGQALDAGDAVIASGGWRFSFAGPRGFVHWAWAGFVTDVEPDGTVVGACLNGQVDNPLEHLGDAHYAGGVWRISASHQARQKELPYRAILAQGLRRLKGEGPYGDRQPWKYRYGLSAMDAWIQKMADVPGFCAPCHARKAGAGRGDALTNAKRMARSSRTACAFLEQRLPHFPEAVRPFLSHAAACYATIAQRLEKTAQMNQTAESYDLILGDLPRQRAHVEKVILPVRAHLEEIASMLAQALQQWPETAEREAPVPA